MRRGLLQESRCFRVQVSQCASPQGLHNYRWYFQPGQYFILFLGAISTPIEVIKLNLGKIPSLRLSDFLQYFRSIVKRETDSPDSTLGLLAAQKFIDFKLFRLRPSLTVEKMQQIEIEVLCSTFVQLFLEETLNIFFTSQSADWHLGGQIIRITWILGEQIASAFFTVAIVIKIGGVEIVHASRQGPGNLPLHCRIIDFGRVASDGRQAHHTKA